MAELLVVAGISALVFLLAALAQAVSGFGSALVAVPLLALAIGPSTAVVAATMVSLLLSAGAWRRERAHVETSLAKVLTLAGVLGMPFGLVILTRADERSLSVLVACGLLLAVALLGFDVSLPRGRRALWTTGVASGVLLTSTGMNGPPLVLSLEGAGLSARRFRATLQSVFCSQDAVAVAAFALAGHLDATTSVAVLGGAAGLPAGWMIGNRVFHRLSPQRFRAIVLGGLVLTAVTALGSALVSA